MTDEHRPKPRGGDQWARLRIAADVPLRRGAWYRVLSSEGRTVNLSVNGKPIPALREQLEMRSTPPRAWTVVRPDKRPVRVPEHLKYGYVVCPSCRTRAQIPPPGTQEMRCPRCSVVCEIAWDEK